MTPERITLDLAYWQIQLVAPYGRVTMERWNVLRQHQFIMWLTRLVGPDIVSTLITMGPALRVEGGDRWSYIQVALMERADALRDGLLKAVMESGQALGLILKGVNVSQVHRSSSPPTPDFSNGLASGVMPDPFNPYPAQHQSIPQTQPTVITAPPIETAVWDGTEASALNYMFPDVLAMYRLVGAVCMENLFPLDSGKLALRASTKTENPYAHHWGTRFPQAKTTIATGLDQVADLIRGNSAHSSPK